VRLPRATDEESDMNTESRTARIGTNLVAASLAAMIATALIGGIASMFVTAGKPFEPLVIAERACKDAVYVSERSACIEAFIADSQRRVMAAR
jgi:hypothetical protein